MKFLFPSLFSFSLAALPVITTTLFSEVLASPFIPLTTPPPTTPPPSESGSFCRLENSKVWNSDSACLDTAGPSCQLRSIDGTQNSCGPGVPAGFYPDLTRCDAYCKCTGTSAPSEYMILGHDLECDTHQQNNNVFLPDVFGKHGAWGTNGGGQGNAYQLSEKGKERPPHYYGGGTVVTTPPSSTLSAPSESPTINPTTTSPTSSPTTSSCSSLLEEKKPRDYSSEKQDSRIKSSIIEI